MSAEEIGFITFVIGVFLLLLALIGPAFQDYLHYKMPDDPAVRGYKVAFYDLENERFRGVSGGGYYSADSLALGKGFHAFYNFEDAEKLQRKIPGSVILEVVLYGVLEKRETGAIASRQRVLQFIMPKCSRVFCKKQSSYLVRSPVEFDLISPSGSENIVQVFSVCRNHYNQISKFASWVVSLSSGQGYSLHVDELRNRFEKDGVVVANSSGEYKFIPTEHPDLAVSG